MWVLDDIAKENCYKILDEIAGRDFEDVKMDDVRYIVRHINANVNWKKKKQYTTHQVILEIVNFLMNLKYFENTNRYFFSDSDYINSYYILAARLHSVIRKKWPDIPTSIEEYRESRQLRRDIMNNNTDDDIQKFKNSKHFPIFKCKPYKNIIWSKVLCGEEIGIEKCRYVLKDYLTYISPKWGTKYSDNFGLVQFLFFRFKTETEQFCRDVATEIVSTLKSTRRKKDKAILDQISIFDSDEDIKPLDSKYYISKSYSVDSKTLNAIDRLAEQQIINSASYQEQEIARINLMIREAMF